MLILVVGPSGAGKDTLLGAASAALAGDPRFRFVRRAVTRPPHGNAANEEAVEEAEFRRRHAARAFALWWEAHGLLYGVPADIGPDLRAGRIVIASVSRAVLAPAAARFPVRVVEITAPPDLLARRLAARGREPAGEIAARLSRAVALPAGLDITVIVNDGPVERAARAFLAHLRRLADEADIPAATAENGSTA